MHNRKLCFWKFWKGGFGFLGIQFGFVQINNNTLHFFGSLGFNVDDQTILMLDLRWPHCGHQHLGAVQVQTQGQN